MSDLWTFRGVSDGVAGTFDLMTRQMRMSDDVPPVPVTVDHIELDKGMVAKIWDLEVEGVTGEVILWYSIDDGTVWVELKRFIHGSATVGDRQPFMTRPITIDAKNDDTSIRFTWVDSGVGLYLTTIIEFDDIKTQD